MNKKLVFVIQIVVLEKYEGRIRLAFKYIQEKIVNVFKGQMEAHEVKLHD